MSDPKENKRYYLAERMCVERRTYEDCADYDNLIIAIEKYNSKNKNPFFCTKPVCEFNNVTGLFDVSFIKYRKINNEAQCLKGIDLLTMGYNDQSSFKESIKENLIDSRNQVNIVYRSKKNISSKKMLYSDDKKYLVISEIIKSMLLHAKDVESYDRAFFIQLCNDKLFTSDPNCIPFLEAIEIDSANAAFSRHPMSTMHSSITNFVDYFVHNKDGEEIYLNVRNLGMYVKRKSPKPTLDNEVYEQLKIDLESHVMNLTPRQ
ncbi:MAG: hypothetical protein RSD00_00905 [Bacilli bacterium]